MDVEDSTVVDGLCGECRLMACPYCGPGTEAEAQRQRERAAWGLLPDAATVAEKLLQMLDDWRPLENDQRDFYRNLAQRHYERIRALLEE